MSRMQPAFATIIVFSAFFFGSRALENGDELQDSLAELLFAHAPARTSRVQPCTRRAVDPAMIKACRKWELIPPKPRAEKLEKYGSVLDATKRMLESSEVIFAVKSEGLTVVQRDLLKSKISENVLAATVKNTMMNKALEDFPTFKPAQELTKGSAMWFFCKLEDLRGAVDAVTAWRKEAGLADPKEYTIRGGAMDGEVYDGEGITTLSKLPTKQELIQKVAFLIKQIPTKIAKGIKEVPTGLARGIKAISEKEEESA